VRSLFGGRRAGTSGPTASSSCGSSGGYVVQKIFYLVIGTLIYVYLFSAIAGSFDFQFGNEWDAISSHAVLTIAIIAGAIFLTALLLRIFWHWFKKMWEKARHGTAILGDFGSYVKLVLPAEGGSKLVRDSYGGAKVKAAEMKASRGTGIGEPEEPAPTPDDGA
jgi:hypothetical protein